MSVPCLNCDDELFAPPRRVLADGFSTIIGGKALDLEDDPMGGVKRIVCREIDRIYRPQDLDLPEKAIIFDLGAHVGAFSCYAGLRWPDARIVAVEPVQGNVAMLRRNLIANNVTNVTVIEAAVAPLRYESPGKVTIFANMAQNSGGSSMFTGGDPIVCKAVTLQSLFDEYAPDGLDLMKIDIEGAERVVLPPAIGLLRRTKWVIGELHGQGEEWQSQVELIANIVTEAVGKDNARFTAQRMGDAP